MPKITGPGAASNAEPVPPQEFDQGKFFNHGEKEGDPVSAGSNSSVSAKNSGPTLSKPKQNGTGPKPARTTANR